MSGARGGALVVPVALYSLCAVYAMAYLRLLFEPATAWLEVAITVAAVGAVGIAARQIRPRTGRIAVLVLGALAGLAIAIGLRRGAWPWREDLRGTDGYLGAGGYLDEVVDAGRDAAAAWVRVYFPADAPAEPDAVAVVRLITLVLLMVCAAGLIVFRVPLLGVLAAAAAATPVTLFLEPERIALHGAGLCLVAVLVLGGGGLVERARPVAPTALAAGGLLGLAIVLAALPGVTRASAFDWRTWTFAPPQPVNVGFVWEQDLVALDFGTDAVPVLEVDDPEVGYLRVGSLEEFDGYRWIPLPRALETVDGLRVALPDALVAPALRDRREAVRRVELRNIAVRTRDLPLPPDALGFSGLPSRVQPVTFTSGGSAILSDDLPLGATYTVEIADPPERSELAAESQRAAVPDPEELRVDDGIYPPFGEPGREAEVPTVLRAQIRGDIYAASTIYGWTEVYREVRAVTAEATSPYEATVLLENWFQTEFTYDETASYIGTSVLGPLPTFLLSERRAAHCQYFAGSMAVLLRMLGIPARVAYGFAPGEVDGAQRIVTNRDAHAWVEVRFPESGWVTFDPTPPRARAALAGGSLTGVTPSEIALPGGQLGAGVGGSLPLTEADGPNRGTAVIGPSGVNGDQQPASPWPRRLLVTLGALAAILLAGLAVWLAKALRVWRARRTDDPRRAACAAHAELAGWLDDQGVTPETRSTADVGARAERAFGVPTEQWVDAVVLARYGPPADAEAALHVVRTETRRVTHLLRRRTRRRDRARGAVRTRRLFTRW